MPRSMQICAAAMLVALTGQAAQAAACDYKPSRLGAIAAGAIAGGAAAGVEAARTTASYYTLVHEGSGLTMIGAATAGASTAAGIVAGAGGTLGTIGSILMAPATLVVGGTALVGGSAYEAVCFFQVERITDPADVRGILESVAANDPTAAIVATGDGDALRLETEDGPRDYLLDRLYIADGELLHRDRLRNTNLGPIFLSTGASE
ncbi:hypothetical protein [uncultured Jannaschia sp.]|uniref:hypothetical protein n=1 Tax=uncultured Jannaschia sp. TaxID=293347 RepID=UPI002604F384|nr:hypothetical protein [uncultured Jannaschia sp.]